ncbi:MAG: hypothetical protein ACRDG7_09745, partial [Candidatus Limnocylindria bacterium]
MMLTTGTRHGAGILDALARHGIRPDLVILERPRGRQLMSRVREMRRRRGILATIGAVVRGVLGRLRPSAEPWRTAEFYAPRSGRLVVVESLAGEETAEVVRDLQT